MSYDTLRYVFIVCLILACVMLAVAVILFFVLNIPKVIRDLSGITAKRAIKEIREQNELSGDKSHKVSVVNRDRGKLTDKISPSGNIIQRSQTQMGLGIETAKIDSTPPAPETSVLGSETSVLTPETSVLGAETSVIAPETSVLGNGMETSVLSSVQTNVSAGETAVLSENMLPAEEAPVQSAPVQVAGFNVEIEITYIHTNEIIETGVM